MESLAWGYPGSDILLIVQNPATANTFQQQRAEVYKIPARRGYGFVDATVVIDTANFESFSLALPASGGGARSSKALKVMATAAGALISQYIPVPARGCWVTYAIRARVAPGQPLTVARMAISATGVSVSQSGEAVSTGAFSWSFLTALIPAGVDQVRALIYVDSGATPW